MKERFEYRGHNTILVLGIAQILLGVLYALFGGSHIWVAVLWTAIGIVSIYRYHLFRKHGYLQIDDHGIHKNLANVKGLQQISIGDIEQVVFSAKYYDILSTNGETMRVHKQSIYKHSLPLLEEAFTTINRRIESYGRTV